MKEMCDRSTVLGVQWSHVDVTFGKVRVWNKMALHVLHPTLQETITCCTMVCKVSTSNLMVL